MDPRYTALSAPRAIVARSRAATGRMQVVDGTRLGPYRVVRKLGEGGMGAVFEAVHERLQKRVAIKTLHEAIARDAEAVGRFVREGRAASRIRHAHVVDVTDVGVEEGTPYLVMEMLDGESLASLLARIGPLAIPTIVDIALPVLDALGAAHAAGVVHRDLKPENVFLSRSRGGGELHPIVLDFGISWIEDEVRLTKTAHFMGTPFYMSPEQAQSARSVDARSDQFSLGLVLFELVTGRRALSGQSVLEIVHRVSTEGAPRLSAVRPDLPPPFCAIVDRMTERHPDARFGSMREVGAALLPFASQRAMAVWGAAFLGGSLVVQTSAPTASASMRHAPGFHTPASGAPSFSTPPTSASPYGAAGSGASPSSAPGFGAPSFRTPASSTPSFSTPPPRGAAPSAHGLATDPTVSAPGGPPSSSVPPATTTLRGAARESVAAAPPSRSGAVFAAISMIALIGTIVLAYVVGSTLARQAAATASAPTAAEVATAPPTAVVPEPALPTRIEVRLRALPPTAEIVLDGILVGTGSYAGDLTRDGIPHVLEVRAPGYVPHHIQFLDIAPVAQIELERIPRHHRGPIEPQRSHMTEAGLVAGEQSTAPIAVLPPVAVPAAGTGAGAATDPTPAAAAPATSTAAATAPATSTAAATATAPATAAATAPPATSPPATPPEPTSPPDARPPQPRDEPAASPDPPREPPPAAARPEVRDDDWEQPRTNPDLIPFD